MKTDYTGRPVIGKYVLDTLSVGMYSNPLMLLREYIQNSVDAIDKITMARTPGEDSARIDIAIDGRSRKVIISDNGTGLSVNDARSALQDIGRSLKRMPSSRGFRGIGRLGGLGYCGLLKFVTKAATEQSYSVSTWDCEKLRHLMKDDNQVVEITDVIQAITEFEIHEYLGSPADHFFVVEMHRVKGARDALLNVPVIKSYVSQVAPVPFNPVSFAFTDELDRELRKRVPNYSTYEISINGEQVFKQYSDEVSLCRDSKEVIRKIDFVDLRNSKGVLATGWIAKLHLLGMVRSSSLIDGLRLRTGNILIGDKNALCDLFRERRFNNYLIGEIHTVDEQLIPNSRRDYFEDNHAKEEFCDCFIRSIGLPYSKKIRELSVSRSKEKQSCLQNRLFEEAEKIVEEGFVSTAQKQRVIAELGKILAQEHKLNDNGVDLIRKIEGSCHFLDMNHAKIAPSVKKVMKEVFDVMYVESSNKKEAEATAKKIASTFSES